MKVVKPVILSVDNLNKLEILNKIETAARNCYKSTSEMTEETAIKMIERLIASGHESVLEHQSITVKFICDVGAYKDITRHRHASFSIESTRWCNYSNDKFGNELTFVKPCNIEEDTKEYSIWLDTMLYIEQQYNEMSRIGAKPDQLRLLLPHSTAATVVMTANLREWRHIFKLRCSKSAHPAVQQIMKQVLVLFKSKIPAVFDDIKE